MVGTLMFGNLPSDPYSIFTFAKRYLREWETTSSVSPLHPTSSLPSQPAVDIDVIWTPAIGVIKGNVDVAIFQAQNHYSYSAVFCDSDGLFISAMSGHSGHSPRSVTPTMAEALGL
ncbi:hypothetical protein JCGZ_06637 [Jatropha curcas]|uniref:RNase H type-1 domain-containing protein n=1 Tax=Jatropha curcas TaxID=180498 RepID=A0A067LCB4_JATCU|nr:hypothetical protein JCGZ_06637 [Jatropha curcas]